MAHKINAAQKLQEAETEMNLKRTGAEAIGESAAKISPGAPTESLWLSVRPQPY